VLYAPDYVINAGGIIVISHESRPGGPAYDHDAAYAHISRIHDTLLEIFTQAERAGVATSEAADRLAETRFRQPRSQAA
jgi:leucine dehydrogenase